MKSKKGIFFTIIAIALLAIVVYSFSVFTYSMTDKSLVIQTRVDTMNNFIKDIEADIERGFYISVYRTVLGMQQYVVDNATYLADAEQQFLDVFFNGSINETLLIITEDNLFSDWVFKIWERGHSIGIDVNITVNEVVLYQQTPWELKADLDATIILTDDRKTSKWEKEKIFTTAIPVSGMEDVLYAVNLELKGSNMIQESPFKGNFSDGVGVVNFLDHLDNSETYLVGSYYVESDEGPGFLDRLEGRTSEYRSGTGIESFVNYDRYVDMMGAGDASYYFREDVSCLDYIQFDTADPLNFNVTGMQSWFRIDNTSNKLKKYNVSGLALKN